MAQAAPVDGAEAVPAIPQKLGEIEILELEVQILRKMAYDQLHYSCFSYIILEFKEFKAAVMRTTFLIIVWQSSISRFRSE